MVCMTNGIYFYDSMYVDYHHTIVYTLYSVILTHGHVDEYVFSGVESIIVINFCVISHVSYMNTPTQYHKSHQGATI